MIEEQALVVELKGEHAIIEIQRQNACQSCEMSGGCGTGSLGRLLGYKPLALSIKNRHKLQVADNIVIGLPEKYFHTAGFLMYLLPLIFLFGFGMAANYYFNATEWINVLASLFGLAFGFLIINGLSKTEFSLKMKPQYIRHSLSFQRVDPHLTFK